MNHTEPKEDVLSIKDDVARRVALEAQRDRINEELALIIERQRALGYGTHDAGDWTLQVSPNRTFNKDDFAQRFPVAQYPEYYKPAINLDAVKENLAPVELKKWYVEGTPKTVVK